MYGDVNNLDHVRCKGNVQTGSFGSKRDPELLFSRAKRTSQGLKPLLLALNSGNGGRREWATARLARIGPRANFLLCSTMLHGDPMARAAAAEAVCRMAKLGFTNSCASKLLIALNDDSPYVRWRTLAGISRMGPQSTHFVKEMFKGLYDSSSLIRVHAVRAIAATYRKPRVSYPDDIHDLRMLLKREGDMYVRGEMMAALCKVEREYDTFKRDRLNPIKYRR